MTIEDYLKNLGIDSEKIHHNLTVDQLLQSAVDKKEGFLASNGALVVRAKRRTGRSPKDRFIVKDVETRDEIWWNNINLSTDEAQFDRIYRKALDYLRDRKDIYVHDGFVGADPGHRLNVRTISEKAWISLFAKTLFIRPNKNDLKDYNPGFTVINVCDLTVNPKIDGTRSEVVVLLSMTKKTLIVVGSEYGGEVKKGIFTVMNYLLPQKGVFPMHCSANIGKSGDAALFFGLSGTGKTTLSADPNRRLIGDDEHGWSENGIFNFEGGCYAKVINLSKEAEPQIYDAIKYGSILENVVTDKDGNPDYNDGSITENTRATYPVEHIPNCELSGKGGHPKNIFFLTCDAFGVLPPIAKLTPDMAAYHFLAGYTAKVAGTEAGITEPQATFSTCFGAPFMPLHPTKYATMLSEHMAKHKSNCWLVNTGWSGGPYGVGARMKISITRALLTAALEGKLDDVEYTPDPTFKVLVPDHCDGVPQNILKPRNGWTDKSAYDQKGKHLAKLFQDNFKQYADYASQDVIQSGPTEDLSC